MQTQQISGVHGGGMLYTSKSAPAKSADGSFDQLIQMSQSTGSTQEQVQKPAETAKKDAVAEVEETKQPEQTTDVADEKVDTKASTEEKTELAKAEGTEEATDVEAAERAAGILAQVTEVVKEVLDLTDEQLNAFMEELGITAMDLLQPETLQNLVLMANSEQDAVILLTDAELLTTVNQLAEQVEQVLKQAGVTPEELAAALESPEFEAMVTEALEQLKEVEGEETEEVKVSPDVENETAVTTVETTETTTAQGAERKQGNGYFRKRAEK